MLHRHSELRLIDLRKTVNALSMPAPSADVRFARQEPVWPEPHTHPGGWSPDGASFVGVQHGAAGSTRVVVCRAADAACREVTQGTSPKWSPDSRHIYFLRPAPESGTQQLWSITVDGAHERQIADLGSLRPLDTFFDRGVTRRRIAWARSRPGGRSSGPPRSSEAVATTHRRWRTEAGAITFPELLFSGPRFSSAASRSIGWCGLQGSVRSSLPERL